MKVILADRTIRLIDSPVPIPVTVLLEREGINPLEVMVTCNNRLVTEDTLVSGNDEIRIIRISHGG